MLARVLEQEIFPSEVLKTRAKKASSRKKKVSVNVDADISTDNAVAAVTPGSTEEAPLPPPPPPPNNVITTPTAPPTTLLLSGDTNTQSHEHANQVNNNHIV